MAVCACKYEEKKLDRRLFVPKTTAAGTFQPIWVNTFTDHRS